MRDNDCCVPHIEVAEARGHQVQNLRAEVERMRSALDKYGAHLSFCRHVHVNGADCDCGLDAASGKQ